VPSVIVTLVLRKQIISYNPLSLSLNLNLDSSSTEQPISLYLQAARDSSDCICSVCLAASLAHQFEHRIMNNKFRSNTLYNETGNIRLYRVSEETRKKGEKCIVSAPIIPCTNRCTFIVLEDSKRIENDNLQSNLQSRRRFKREEDEKFRVSVRCICSSLLYHQCLIIVTDQTREKFRLGMISRWVDKSKNSPFAVDQLATDDQRVAKRNEYLQQKKIYDDKVRMVEAMTGKAENVLGKVTLSSPVHSIDEKTKLALRYRQSLLDTNVIGREKNALNKMLEDELAFIAESFPVVAEKSASLLSQSGNNTSMMDDSNSTIPSTEPQSQNELGVRRESQCGDATISTGFSGRLTYTAPAAEMRALADDISETFNETNLDFS
jgi:hypothetical protein